MEFNKKVFKKAFHWYVDTVKGYVDEELKEKVYTLQRPEQLKIVTDVLFKHLNNFEQINCIETGASNDIVGDGAVGLYFAKLCELTNGKFHSVEINSDLILKSENLYKKHNLNVKHHQQDSVNYLKTTEFIPNLIHLDSWDVDLKNPLPSALHGWREFKAIENKMPIGSIIIIDDNFFNGTWVEWITIVNGKRNVEKIDITQPVVGKGSLVWHFVKDKMDINDNNWEMIYPTEISWGTKKIMMKKIK
tara:strand:+ start:5780 stop:6520 length:741 start_codon:yes stop_codon:yes gene_type:complete